MRLRIISPEAAAIRSQLMIVEYPLLAQCKPLYFAVIRVIFSADANANQMSEFESLRTGTALLTHPALVGTASALFGAIAFSCPSVLEEKVNRISIQHRQLCSQ